MVLVILALAVSSAVAQVEVSGAYQFSRAYVNGTTINSNPGWDASLFVPFSGGLGVVTEWTGTGFDKSSHSFSMNTGAGGLQYEFNHKGHLRPYANALLGDTWYSAGNTTQSAFSQQVGGGLDLALTKHFAVRGGLNYIHVDSTSKNLGSANGIRPLAGIVFRF